GERCSPCNRWTFPATDFVTRPEVPKAEIRAVLAVATGGKDVTAIRRHSQSEYQLGMPRTKGDFLAALQVPATQGNVFIPVQDTVLYNSSASGEKTSALRQKGQAPRNGRLRKAANFPASFQVPQAHDTVIAARQESPAIGRKGHTPHQSPEPYR